MRAALLIVVLVGVLLAGLNPILGPGAPRARRRVKIEGASAGALAPGFLSASFVKATCVLSPVRIGASLLDVYFDGISGSGCLCPVHVGYTIWAPPSRHLFVDDIASEVYAEASAGIVPGGWRDLTARVSLCWDVDYLANGLRFEGGWLSMGWHGERRSTWFAGGQLRFVTAEVPF
jgi:hypothetical protein